MCNSESNYNFSKHDGIYLSYAYHIIVIYKILSYSYESMNTKHFITIKTNEGTGEKERKDECSQKDENRIEENEIQIGNMHNTPYQNI